MKRYPVIFGLCLALLATAGCSHTYNIKTTSGRTIVAASKPKLQNGKYVFKDARGAPQYISAGQVAEIDRSGISKEDKKIFKPSTSH